MSREAVLLLNHVVDEDLRRLHEELTEALEPDRHVWLLSDRTQRSLPFIRLSESRRELVFRTPDLESLGYPGKSSLTLRRAGSRNMQLGNTDLPVLLFARAHPEYDRFWVIEYDVRFTGSWRMLLDTFDDNSADLLATSVCDHAVNPGWSHWPSLQFPQQPVAEDERLRAFLPIYRISAPALALVDEAYRSGVRGHYEVTMPTILHLAGRVVQDISGEGNWGAPGIHRRLYYSNPADNSFSPGTFVYRPIMQAPGDRPDTLWHPVKPDKPFWLAYAEKIWRRLWRPVDAWWYSRR